MHEFAHARNLWRHTPENKGSPENSVVIQTQAKHLLLFECCSYSLMAANDDAIDCCFGCVAARQRITLMSWHLFSCPQLHVWLFCLPNFILSSNLQMEVDQEKVDSDWLLSCTFPPCLRKIGSLLSTMIDQKFIAIINRDYMITQP